MATRDELYAVMISLGSGMGGSVSALSVFDDGSGPALYAGGSFLAAGGVPASSIARWNGTAWSALGSGTGGTVLALVGFDDGGDGDADLYVGGSFSSNPGPYVAEWHGCGTLSFCFGDGSGASCPCSNSGALGHGCQNSASTGGAQLAATGTSSPDALVLHATGEIASALSIFLQGNADLGTAVPFGDGLRCAGGVLKRLYAKAASGGAVDAPIAGDPSITARSAALGDPIAHGSARYYQVYYRDAADPFCPSPPGSTFNVGNALRILW